MIDSASEHFTQELVSPEQKLIEITRTNLNVLYQYAIDSENKGIVPVVNNTPEIESSPYTGSASYGAKTRAVRQVLAKGILPPFREVATSRTNTIPTIGQEAPTAKAVTIHLFCPVGFVDISSDIQIQRLKAIASWIPQREEQVDIIFHPMDVNTVTQTLRGADSYEECMKQALYVRLKSDMTVEDKVKILTDLAVQANNAQPAPDFDKVVEKLGMPTVIEDVREIVKLLADETPCPLIVYVSPDALQNEQVGDMRIPTHSPLGELIKNKSSLLPLAVFSNISDTGMSLEVLYND